MSGGWLTPVGQPLSFVDADAQLVPCEVHHAGFRLTRRGVGWLMEVVSPTADRVADFHGHDLHRSYNLGMYCGTLADVKADVDAMCARYRASSVHFMPDL